MLCDQILGNLSDPGGARWLAKRADLVDVQWHECGSRALRKTSRAGRPFRILLPLGVTLRHGDILAEDEESVTAVHLVPTEVLVARPRTMEAMAALALEIGNLHAPAQAIGDELLVIPDGPVEAALFRLGVPHEMQTRRFVPTPVSAAPAVGLAAGLTVIRSAG